ncbi:MAG: hypothetical protein IKA20_00265 [Clostridia bacterium]|nr:hypothetical protein [Clostridia bacterium]
MPSGKKRAHAEFIESVSIKNPSIQILGIYKKNTSPILCKCSRCDYKWSPTPKTLLNGHGCPRCSNNIKLSNDDFVKRLKFNNPHFSNIALLSEYEGMSKKIKCKCRICETVWSSKANDLIRAGSGCPSCSGNIGYTQKRFFDNLRQKNPHVSKIEFLSEYKGATKRIQCKCIICNHIWNPLASSLLQGTGCPKCAKKRIAIISSEQLKRIKRPGKISHDAFIDKFNTRNPHANTIHICTQYNGAANQIACRCIVCGHEWRAIASRLLSGSGCPVCAHTSTSFMEQFLLHALCLAVGTEKIIHRGKKALGKELDIFLPDFAFAVEIGSWKWHKEVLQKDIQKANECASKNIKLVIIYDSYSGDEIFENDVWVYGIDLGSEKNYSTLKTIVYRCLNLINVSYSFSEDEWNEIISFAYKSSRRITHDDFIDKLKCKNPHYEKIILLTEYHYARDKIKCECKKCGHLWETVASELLKGTGCPVCQIKLVGEKKSKKFQVIEWRKQNPTGTKRQCEIETNISRMTIYKWWDSFNT